MDVAALDVIGQLLFSPAAALYQEVVIRRQLAGFISGGAEDHRDPYLFTIAARGKSDAAMKDLEKAIDTQLDSLKQQTVSRTSLGSFQDESPSHSD